MQTGQIGRIESLWRYPVKGMRGEEIPHTYTAYTGLMGDRIYGVVAADGDPSHPWREFSRTPCERRSQLAGVRLGQSPTK